MADRPQPRRYAPLAKEDLSDRAARELRTAILTGEYSPGERLPSERELSEQFDVDRHTLRSAVHELELLGLIQRRRGAGAHVMPFRETASLDLVPFLVKKPGTDELDRDVVASVADVSRLMFGGVVALAVARADESDLASMRAAMAALETSALSGSTDEVIVTERNLLRVIVQGAHSIVCELFVNSFERMFNAAVDPSQYLHERWAEQAATPQTLETYRTLLRAIEARDEAEARRVIGELVGAVSALADQLDMLSSTDEVREEAR